MKFLRFIILCAIFPTIAMQPHEAAINQEIKTLTRKLNQLRKELKKAKTQAQIDAVTAKINGTTTRLNVLKKHAQIDWLLDNDKPTDAAPKNPLAQTIVPSQFIPEDFSEVEKHQKEFYTRVEQRRNRDERMRSARQRAWAQGTTPQSPTPTRDERRGRRIATSSEIEEALHALQ